MNSTAAKALEIKQCNNQATASNPLFILELFKVAPKSSGLFVSFVYNLPGWEIILLIIKLNTFRQPPHLSAGLIWGGENC
jgi:hypothetical protein